MVVAFGMSDLELSDEQWAVIAPLLPPKPKTGRRRRHDRQVWTSLVYRLKTDVRYKDITKGGDYAAKRTVYRWLRRWGEAGVLEALWRHLLRLPEAHGKLSLVDGGLNGSFVPSKWGAKG